MYLWKIDNLIAELRNGTLSQAARFKYLLAFMLITVIILEISIFVSEVPSVASLSESIIVILITVLGTIWCYQTNKSGDNQEFIDRFICLTLPILVRIFVIFLLIFSLYMTIGFLLFGDSFDKFTEKTNWIDVGFTICFEFYYYWKLSNAISLVANKRLEQTPKTGAAQS